MRSADVVGDPTSAALGFVTVLRRCGLPVPVTSAHSYVEALGIVGLDDPAAAYWAGRCTLVHRPGDVGVHDTAFVAYWGAARGQADSTDTIIEPVSVVLDDADPDESDADDQKDAMVLRYSATETLMAKDFAAYSDAELREARQVMAQMRFAGPARPSRRLVASDRRAGRLDIRRTLRTAMRNGGEPIRVHRRTRNNRTRRLVLLLDVSGSMEAYARALLRFVQAAVAARSRVEAFALGTRLTRLTRELSSRDPDKALADAARAVADWSGGTRLGEGLRCFNDEWGCRGLARGAVVVVLSDGWDRGDPDTMTEQMARLRRVAHRVVWVNPLKATPGYEPLARGMAAALPHVDAFVEGHSLDSLTALAEIVFEDTGNHASRPRRVRTAT